MAFDKYGLIFLLFTYAVSLIAFVLFIYISVVCIIDLINKRKIIQKRVKSVLLLICFVCMILAAPWWFLSAAFNTKSVKNIELFHKLSVKTSILPYVRSYMYNNLGEHYYANYEGEKAIYALEKSKFLDSLFALCSLYTIKGDYVKGVEVCNAVGMHQAESVNYILNKDYKKALEAINLKFKNSQNLNCMDYATRGYIYKKSGRISEAKKDFDKASKMCNDKEKIKKIASEDSYFENLYAKTKIKYNF